VYRTTLKKKELIAEIKNVTSSITVTIDNPVVEDLRNMEYL